MTPASVRKAVIAWIQKAYSTIFSALTSWLSSGVLVDGRI